MIHESGAIPQNGSDEAMKYPLPEELRHCMKQTQKLLGISEQELITHALKAFFFKHGVLHRSYQEP